MTDQQWFPKNSGIVRLGYSGFLSAVWVLWKMNRNARQIGLKSKLEITLPMPWLK